VYLRTTVAFVWNVAFCVVGYCTSTVEEYCVQSYYFSRSSDEVVPSAYGTGCRDNGAFGSDHGILLKPFEGTII
jgi:hypothetical protein